MGPRQGNRVGGCRGAVYAERCAGGGGVAECVCAEEQGGRDRVSGAERECDCAADDDGGGGRETDDLVSAGVVLSVHEGRAGRGACVLREV